MGPADHVCFGFLPSSVTAADAICHRGLQRYCNRTRGESPAVSNSMTTPLPIPGPYVPSRGRRGSLHRHLVIFDSQPCFECRPWSLMVKSVGTYLVLTRRQMGQIARACLLKRRICDELDWHPLVFGDVAETRTFPNRKRPFVTRPCSPAARTPSSVLATVGPCSMESAWPSSSCTFGRT